MIRSILLPKVASFHCSGEFGRPGQPFLIDLNHMKTIWKRLWKSCLTSLAVLWVGGGITAHADSEFAAELLVECQGGPSGALARAARIPGRPLRSQYQSSGQRPCTRSRRHAAVV